MRAEAPDLGHCLARVVLDLMRRVAREPYRVYAEDEFFANFGLDPHVERADAAPGPSAERSAGTAGRRHRVGVAALVVGAFGVVGGLVAAEVLSSRARAGGAPVARTRMDGETAKASAAVLVRRATQTVIVPATAAPVRAVARARAPRRVLRTFADARAHALRRASAHRDPKPPTDAPASQAAVVGAEDVKPAEGRPALAVQTSGRATLSAVAHPHSGNVEFSFER
jgi:hypothetical protein